MSEANKQGAGREAIHTLTTSCHEINIMDDGSMDITLTDGHLDCLFYAVPPNAAKEMYVALRSVFETREET